MDDEKSISTTGIINNPKNRPNVIGVTKEIDLTHLDVSEKPNSFHIENNFPQIPSEDKRRFNNIKVKKIQENSGIIKSFVWSCMGVNSYMVMVYTILNYINNKYNVLIIREEKERDFEFEYNKKTSILLDGEFVFNYNEYIIYCLLDARALSVQFKTNGDLTEIIKEIDYEIKENNPLRNKHIHILPNYGDFIAVIKKLPKTTFDDVILPKDLKEDIYDNTIFQLEEIEGNNGIILYGPPGTGKSLICQAIIQDAINKGYSTCFVTTAVDYSLLNEFIERFLAPCIVIFEDIDSFGQSRTNRSGDSGVLSDFLQFLSGVYERDEKLVFIATTNYLEHLDEAIKNRPMRFNRKFEFKLPETKEIDRLIKLYFIGEEEINPMYYDMCYGLGFTGSHIKEVYRTARLMSTKNNLPIQDVFELAVERVSENFSTTLIPQPVGFGRK